MQISNDFQLNNFECPDEILRKSLEKALYEIPKGNP